MPTLLVTRKMRPELAARVQASVEGRRAAPGARLAPRVISRMRVTLVAVILVTLCVSALSLRRSHLEIEGERAALTARVQRESASLSLEDRAAPARMLRTLALMSGDYAGDLVANELIDGNAFVTVTARPTAYARGPLSDFKKARLAESNGAAFADAFVGCLLVPPASRTEKLLRRRVRAITRRAEHIEPLRAALVGLPLLAPEWAARVASADSRAELHVLQKTFDRAPLASAERAARARQLLFVIDEPGDTPGPSELDGERPHYVRVGLVDLGARKVLLRLRRRVDPGWLSPATRAELATDVDSCALAYDVRAAVDAKHRATAGN